jgi:hypothetical protein
MWVVCSFVELLEQVFETVRNPLLHDIVVDAVEDIPQSPLVLPAQASSGLSRGGIRLHGVLCPY